jgi:hypothetical protein
MLARSPDRKRATEYLVASGAVPITVTTTGTIRTGTVTGKGRGARWWVSASMAVPVASAARRLAGPAPDASEAIEAVTRSASLLRASLTPDDVAVERAAASMMRLDSMFEAMRASGQLREFNRAYKIRRAAALAAGHGFMNYSTALRRLKFALVPMLQQGKPMRGVFDEIFR